MGITWKWSTYLPCYLSFPVSFLSILSPGMDKGEPQPSYCWDYHKPHVMGSGEQGPAVPWINWMSLLSGMIIHDHAGKRTTSPTQSDTWSAQGWGDRMDWWSGHQVLNIFLCADRTVTEILYLVCTFHSWHGAKRGGGSSREALVHLSAGEHSRRWWVVMYMETAPQPLRLPYHVVPALPSLHTCSHVSIIPSGWRWPSSLLIILINVLCKILALMSQEWIPSHWWLDAVIRQSFMLR